MIICLCHAVNRKTLDQAKEEGCETLRQLQSHCMAGSTCGTCIPDLKKALKDAYSLDQEPA